MDGVVFLLHMHGPGVGLNAKYILKKTPDRMSLLAHTAQLEVHFSKRTHFGPQDAINHAQIHLLKTINNSPN